MTAYLLLTISLLAGLTYNILRNLCMKKYIRAQADNYRFNALSGLFTSAVLVVMMCMQGGLHMPSLYTLLLGLLFGAVTAGAAILNMCAFGVGPMSYTTVIISCSMIIPSLYGVFLGQTLHAAHYIGIAMMVACMILSVSKDGEGEAAQKKANLVWLACCMGAFLLNGFIGILQQIHQNSAHRDELNLFLLVAFLFSSVFSLGGWLFCRRPKGKTAAAQERSALHLTPRNPAFYACALTGVCVAAANIINLYLSGVMESAVFFPVVNGGGLILSALAGIVLFRERLSGRKWIGLGVGTAAILLLCLEKVF